MVITLQGGFGPSSVSAATTPLKNEIVLHFRMTILTSLAYIIYVHTEQERAQVAMVTSKDNKVYTKVTEVDLEIQAIESWCMLSSQRKILVWKFGTLQVRRDNRILPCIQTACTRANMKRCVLLSPTYTVMPSYLLFKGFHVRTGMLTFNVKVKKKSKAVPLKLKTTKMFVRYNDIQTNTGIYT
jgi:hypothetical protein